MTANGRMKFRVDFPAGLMPRGRVMLISEDLKPSIS
jgi:hypothetical protein